MYTTIILHFSMGVSKIPKDFIPKGNYNEVKRKKTPLASIYINQYDWIHCVLTIKSD